MRLVFALALVLFGCGSNAESAREKDAATPAERDATTPVERDARTPAPVEREEDARQPVGDAGVLGVWTWHDVPGAICANGTPTGVGINRGSGDHVVIYLSGGSACLDEGCSIGTPSMRKNGGFGAKEMESCARGSCDGNVTFPAKSLFSREPDASPFVDATFVFISNCAGDYYVGDAEHAFNGWTAQFHGSRNQRLFATWLAEAFPSAERVVLTGGSAGAVGVLLNYWQWVAAFPRTRVDLIADSFAFWSETKPEFRYPLHNPQLPPACTACEDYRAIYAFNASLAPRSRIAVLDSEKNVTLDLVSGFMYAKGLQALQPQLDALPNTKYFIANGNVHILMQHPLDSSAIDIDSGPKLSDFLAQMQSDGAWQSESCLGP